MKAKVLLVSVFIILTAVTCCLAEDVRKVMPPVFTDAKSVEMGNKMLHSYPIPEYECEGTMTVVENGETELSSVHLRYKAPVWLLEWSILDPKTREVIRKRAESFNGWQSYRYEEFGTEKRLVKRVSETLPSCPHSHGGARFFDSIFLLQEFQLLVQGGASCLDFNYFAGSGDVGGVKNADAFAAYSDTGWTVVFFDKTDGYPKEIHDGANDTPGFVKTVLTKWARDEKGRWGASQFDDEMRIEGDKTLKTVHIELTKFSRTAKGGYDIVPPDGTIVNEDGIKHYVQGAKEPLQ